MVPLALVLVGATDAVDDAAEGAFDRLVVWILWAAKLAYVVVVGNERLRRLVLAPWHR